MWGEVLGIRYRANAIVCKLCVQLDTREPGMHTVVLRRRVKLLNKISIILLLIIILLTIVVIIIRIILFSIIEIICIIEIIVIGNLILFYSTNRRFAQNSTKNIV